MKVERKKKRQAVENSVIKMWWKGRYSTHTLIHAHIFLLFGSEKKKTQGDKQDTVISAAPSHPELKELHHCVYTVVEEAN